MPAPSENLYYVWDSPSESPCVLLNLRLVESIRHWIDETSPNQEEIGGVLLGRIERGPDRVVVTVEGCQPMHISHGHGPEFKLTEDERLRLYQKFSQHPEDGLIPVGMVRSDLRNDLQPDAADAELFTEASPEAMLLLVCRDPNPIARFFRASVVNTEPAFPFDSEALQQDSGITILHTPTALESSSSWPVSHRVGALVACLLLTIAGAAYFWPQTRTTPASKGFGLNVQHMGKALRLTWNPRSVSGKTVLLIDDGESRRRMALDGRQVAHGSALYVPISNEVTFRLETPRSADSIRIVAPAPQAVSAPVPEVKPQPVKLARRKALPRRPKPVMQSADRIAFRPEALPIQTQAKISSPPMPVQPAPIPAQTPEPVVPKSAPEPLVTVSYTAQPEPVRQGIGKIPVLRMFKRSHALEPARPVSNIQPRLPRGLARQLHGESQIEVRASVDKFGRVSNIQPLSPDADDRLVRLVTEAVSRASFYPAQSNGRDVNSKLVLTFHFAGSDVTRASREEGR
jgi:hypothetical protein